MEKDCPEEDPEVPRPSDREVLSAAGPADGMMQRILHRGVHEASRRQEDIPGSSELEGLHLDRFEKPGTFEAFSRAGFRSQRILDLVKNVEDENPEAKIQVSQVLEWVKLVSQKDLFSMGLSILLENRSSDFEVPGSPSRLSLCLLSLLQDLAKEMGLQEASGILLLGPREQGNCSWVEGSLTEMEPEIARLLLGDRLFLPAVAMAAEEGWHLEVEPERFQLRFD